MAMAADRNRGRVVESFSRLRRRAHLGRRDRYEIHVDASFRSRDAERIGAAFDSVLAEREPVARRRVAASVLAAYDKLNAEGRRGFFMLMAEQLAPDPLAIDKAIE